MRCQGPHRPRSPLPAPPSPPQQGERGQDRRLARAHRLSGIGGWGVRGALALACAFTLASDLLALGPPDRRYEHRKVHDPDGIGKFYLGREIAYVMSYHGASWLERPERVQEERTDRLMQLLPVKPGMTICDLGAGSGYFAFQLAKKVGPKGKILAVDVQKEMLDIIRKRMKRDGVSNVEPVLGTITDPKLPAGQVDLILMVDVYHELSHPYEMTLAMVRSLKPGGKLVFVEYRLEDPDVPIKLVHKMTEKQVKREMAVHPEMKFSKTLRTLPWQHVVIFEKK